MTIYPDSAIAKFIGDELYVWNAVPFVVKENGGSASVSFSDITDGEIDGGIFLRSFQYSLNGIDFSEWFDISEIDSVITNLSFPNFYVFINLKYKYTGVQVGEMSIISIDLSLDNFVLPELDPNTFESLRRSLFKDIFYCNENVIAYSFDLFNAIYNRKVLPSFITISKITEQDEDFIAIWQSVSEFYALFIYFAERMAKFIDPEAVYQSIFQFDIIPKNNSIQFLDLRRQALHRGTLKSFEINSFDENEIARLFNRTSLEYGFIKTSLTKKSGWYLDRYSPLIRSTSGHRNLSNTPMNERQYSPDYISGDFPIIETGACSQNTISFKGTTHSCLTIVESGAYAGIGSFNIANDIEKAIPINPFDDYVISFWLKANSSTEILLSLGLAGALKTSESVTYQQFNNVDEDTDWFYQGSFKIFDEWIYFEAVLYGYDRKDDPFISIPSWGSGSNLRNKYKNNYIIPNILVSLEDPSTVDIIDIQIRPRTTNNKNHCYVNRSKVVIGQIINRNQKLSNSFILDFLTRKSVRHDYCVNFRFLKGGDQAEILYRIDENGDLIYDENNTIFPTMISSLQEGDLFVEGFGEDQIEIQNGDAVIP